MFEYHSQKELYEALIPALNTKVTLTKKLNHKVITKEDIWNYLKVNKWQNSTNLTLADMVQDILHVDYSDFL